MSPRCDRGVARKFNDRLLPPPEYTFVQIVFIACASRRKRGATATQYCMRAVGQFRDLTIACADVSLRNLLARLTRLDVLVIDNWAIGAAL